MGIFWGLNSLRDPNLGCGAGVSHDPDPGLSMIRNWDLPRSGAGSAWTMWGWSFPLVEFPVCPIFPSGLDGGNTLGCPEWDWPCPPFPGILCSYSCDFSWKTTLVAKLLPFFPLGTKPLDRDTPPFTPPGAPGAAPGNEGSHSQNPVGRNERELWNPGALFPGINLLGTSPSLDQI